MSFSPLFRLQIAERVQAITVLNYEPGRQDRNYRAVWKYYVRPEIPITYNTYLKYLKVDVDLERRKFL